MMMAIFDPIGKEADAIPNNVYSVFQMPKQSEWRCRMFGGASSGFYFRPNKGDEPNWFWRKMQYLCFGHVWEKVKT
jgi:hypothetical protein